jgi:hypothetical protein
MPLLPRRVRIVTILIVAAFVFSSAETAPTQSAAFTIRPKTKADIDKLMSELSNWGALGQRRSAWDHESHYAPEAASGLQSSQRRSDGFAGSACRKSSRTG